MSDSTLKSFIPNTVCDSYTTLKLHGMLWVSSRGTPTQKSCRKTVAMWCCRRRGLGSISQSKFNESLKRFFCPLELLYWHVIPGQNKLASIPASLGFKSKFLLK